MGVETLGAQPSIAKPMVEGILGKVSYLTGFCTTSMDVIGWTSQAAALQCAPDPVQCSRILPMFHVEQPPAAYLDPATEQPVAEGTT